MNKTLTTTLTTLRSAALALPLALTLALMGCKDRPADTASSSETRCRGRRR